MKNLSAKEKDSYKTFIAKIHKTDTKSLQKLKEISRLK